MRSRLLDYGAGPRLHHFHRLHVIRFFAELDVRFMDQPSGKVDQGHRRSGLGGKLGRNADVLVEERQSKRAWKGARQHAGKRF
jgi:hypothetical protein